MSTDPFRPSNSMTKLIGRIFTPDTIPALTKLNQDDMSAMYACEARSLLQKERRYMFAFGEPNMISVGSHVRLSDINGLTCLQFRTFDEPIEQHVLPGLVEFDPDCLTVAIKRYAISKDVDNKTKISEYMFEHDGQPMNVHLFHSSDSDFEFMPDGNLLSALLTWDTLLVPSVDVFRQPKPEPEREPDSEYDEDEE